jgi:hypothetical protein
MHWWERSWWECAVAHVACKWSWANFRSQRPCGGGEDSISCSASNTQPNEMLSTVSDGPDINLRFTNIGSKLLFCSFSQTCMQRVKAVTFSNCLIFCCSWKTTSGWIESDIAMSKLGGVLLVAIVPSCVSLMVVSLVGDELDRDKTENLETEKLPSSDSHTMEMRANWVKSMCIQPWSVYLVHSTKMSWSTYVWMVLWHVVEWPVSENQSNLTRSWMEFMTAGESVSALLLQVTCIHMLSISKDKGSVHHVLVERQWNKLQQHRLFSSFFTEKKEKLRLVGSFLIGKESSQRAIDTWVGPVYVSSL